MQNTSAIKPHTFLNPSNVIFEGLRRAVKVWGCGKNFSNVVRKFQCYRKTIREIASVEIYLCQRQDIGGLLDIGSGLAESQANIEIGQAARGQDLTTGIGATLSAGQVGDANAKAQQQQNLLSAAAVAASFFSDARLKTNIKKAGEKAGHNWYTWTWNNLAKKMFGLIGDSEGVIAQQAQKISPNAVSRDSSGYLKVNYGAL